MTGKWHNGGPAVLRGFEKGKAILLGGMSNHEAVPVQDITEEGTFANKRTGKKFSSELFGDAAVEFLEQHDGATPFFAYVAFTAPHDPRQPPLAYCTPYYEKLPPLPPNFMPQHPFDNGWLIGRDENLAAWPRTEAVVRDQLAEYYGMITHMDEQIGRILAVLKEKGFAENTIIVYAADHGLAVGSHGLLGKQNLYEHSMGAPLVFMGPGIPQARESSALTYLMDIMPTLCDVAGIEPPAAVEGANLRAIWEGKQESVRNTLYLTYEDSQRSVQDGRWKLIRYPKIGYMQLFDLEKDTSELENLAGLPEYSEKITLLLAELEAWQKRVGDTVELGEGNEEPEPVDLSGHPRKPDNAQPDWVIKKYF
jgi:arylsulfatase A-like enzyme